MSTKICFHGGKSFDAIGTDFSTLKKKHSIIRADVTDAWYDPHPDIEKALSKELNWFIKNSPPTQSEGLISTISKVRKIPVENILIGGGSSDLMFLAFPSILKKEDEVIILDPMYGEYEHILKHVIGAKILKIKQDRKKDFKIVIDKIIEKITSKTKMIILVNPNNPTGQYLKRKEMLKLLSQIPQSVMLCIDETYIDYIGKNESLETEVDKQDNLLVIKSMSKVYGLSGVRVAYLTANKELISKLTVLSPPWSIGLIGQVAGVIALNNEKYYEKMLKETKKINEFAFQKLSKMEGLRPLKSAANFILIELHTRLNAEKICMSLEQKGIFIRNPQSQSTQLENFIRISIKDKATTNKIIKELKKEIR